MDRPRLEKIYEPNYGMNEKLMEELGEEIETRREAEIQRQQRIIELLESIDKTLKEIKEGIGK